MIKKTNILGTILGFALCMIAISGEAQNAARDYYNQAVEKTDQHAYVEAEKLYNKAIELNPLFHEAWFSLGYNLQML
jgi:tetratricopeptide (TPR) repeat protein